MDEVAFLAFYDFRYSLDPLDPYYIRNYIDVVTSEAYNQKIYDSLFVGKGAKSINRILVGYGAFSGKIIGLMFLIWFILFMIS